MPRLTKQQIHERMKREAKRIRDRNYRFRKMTLQQQRVTIARDVLKLLADEKITAETGMYMQLDDEIDEKYWPWERERQWNDDGMTAAVKKDLNGTQLHELIERTESCEVCGIGACFVAAVRRADQCTVGDMDRGTNDDAFMREYLQSWFDKRQIQLIEAAFEMSAGFAFSHRDRYAAERFGRRYEDDDARLRAIFQNIIDNGGTFDPSDVRT